VGFPRSVIALCVLLVGSALVGSSLLQRDGTLTHPGIREVLCFATLIAAALLILFFDRDGRKKQLRRNRGAVRRRTPWFKSGAGR
jgi:hypothetical protein